MLCVHVQRERGRRKISQRLLLTLPSRSVSPSVEPENLTHSPNQIDFYKCRKGLAMRLKDYSSAEKVYLEKCNKMERKGGVTELERSGCTGVIKAAGAG